MNNGLVLACGIDKGFSICTFSYLCSFVLRGEKKTANNLLFETNIPPFIQLFTLLRH